MTTKTQNTTVRDYQDSLYSQNACNASGLIHSLEDVLAKIWQDSSDVNGGTGWVNKHPIIRLYVEAILGIGGGYGDTDSYHTAYQLVNDVIDGKRNPTTLELKEEA